MFEKESARSSRRSLLAAASGLVVSISALRKAAAKGMMPPGSNQSIDYQAPDATSRTARLTNAKVENLHVPLLQHTDDPNWVVADENNDTKTEQWTEFLLWDGTAGRTRVASELHTPENPSDSEYIISDFVHSNLDGSDERREHALVFTDLQNRYYGATMSNIPSPFDASPIFIIGYLPTVNGAGTVWRVVPGAATDIGVGPGVRMRPDQPWGGGKAWVVNAQQQIFRWNGGGWQGMPGDAVRVAVGPNDNAWVVNAQQQIFQWTGGGWQGMPGAATDVGVGPEGTVWVVNAQQQIFRWNGGGWDGIPLGNGIAISVGDRELPWIVDGAQRILRRI
jgi:hypothetical protein